MKKLFLFAALLISCITYSQTTEKIDLYKGDFSIVKSIKGDDTLVYFTYVFKNIKYKQLTDMGIILMLKKKDVIEFSENLVKFSKHEKGKTINFHNQYFDLNLYDFSSDIYISDSRNKYTSITKTKAISLSEEINSQIHLLKK